MFTVVEKMRALALYDKIGEIKQTVELLGYPSATCLKNWIVQRDIPPEQRTPPKPRVYLSLEEKVKAVKRLEAGEKADAIAEDIGVTGPTIYNWRRDMRGDWKPLRSDDTRRLAEDIDPYDLPDDVDELKKLCRDLKMENELMRRTVDIVKKDPSVDLRKLSNREKTMLIDAMRPTYSLNSLATRLDLPLSSYHYNHAALRRKDKDAKARAAVAEEFVAVRGSRGYRYIHKRLAERGIKAGEKKVRRLMAEQGLEVVYARKPKRKYSSYAGEISVAPPNLLLREDGTHDFTAKSPNELWLTDITEFKIPDDSRKVYLSPILDCFDGKLVAWSVGTRPTADLANKSLAIACESLGEGERPICHSDRGGHYRWPGWISICNEYGLVRSMSRKATSPDNAAMEGFFGTLKQEFFYYRDWSGITAEEFMDKLDEWLVYYNDRRIKRSLGWLSPNQYRKSLGLAA